jgi:hypothetical protein
LSEKLNVICEVEAILVTSQVEIANCLGFAPSSLRRIMLRIKLLKGK